MAKTINVVLVHGAWTEDSPKTLRQDRKISFMNTYETVTEAVNDLVKRGYTDNLNISDVRAGLPEDKINSLSADDFDIDELYRFEGPSDPADEMIVFAVSSNRFGIKGILINAYGMYEETETYELIKALHRRVQ